MGGGGGEEEEEEEEVREDDGLEDGKREKREREKRRREWCVVSWGRKTRDIYNLFFSLSFAAPMNLMYNSSTVSFPARFGGPPYSPGKKERERERGGGPCGAQGGGGSVAG